MHSGAASHSGPFAHYLHSCCGGKTRELCGGTATYNKWQPAPLLRWRRPHEKPAQNSFGDRAWPEWAALDRKLRGTFDEAAAWSVPFFTLLGLGDGGGLPRAVAVKNRRGVSTDF